MRRIAIETLRRILREKNVTFQRTRTWKHSTDPACTQELHSPRTPADATLGILLPVLARPTLARFG